MARIELRDCIVRFKDGLSGTADTAETILEGVTDIDISSPVLNTVDTDLVPVGARFTVADENGSLVHVVTGRTPAATSPTTNIEFTTVPAATGGISTGKTITFLPQQIEIKVGDGNITYTENKTYEYLLDRGDLDTVREGDQVPLDVNLECTFEHITTGTSEEISPMDALKQKEGASGWVSSAGDQCEPYAIDIEVEHNPPCGTSQIETVLFPDFRPDTKEVNYQDATISLSGKCNVTEPEVERTDQS